MSVRHGCRHLHDGAACRRGISTTGLRVAGVGNDEWVQHFVQAKAAAVQVDVGKLDIISDGLIHYQMLPSAKTLVLLFLGAILQNPSYPTSLQTWRRRFDERAQLTLMANGLLPFAVLLT